MLSTHTSLALACLLLLSSAANAQDIVAPAPVDAPASTGLAACLAQHAPKFKSKHRHHAHFHAYVCASDGHVYYNQKVAHCVNAQLTVVSKCFVFKSEKHCEETCKKKVAAQAK